MANPLVLFDTVYDDTGATISSSSEASGFADDNVTDWRPGTAYRWKAGSTTPNAYVRVDLGVGNTATPDTVVIGGHNLNSAGAKYKVVGSSDNFAASNDDMFSWVTPGNDLPNIQTFTGTAYRYWQVLIDDTGGGTFSEAPQIGIITLGVRLDFEVGAQFNLDPYNDDPMTEWSMSHNGSAIGGNLRYLRKRFQIAYDAPGMTDSGFYSKASPNWDDDFVPHSRNKPFWFAWNTAVDAQEVYLCRRVEPISMPFYGSTSRRGVFTTFEAWREAS